MKDVPKKEGTFVRWLQLALTRISI